MNSPIVKPNMLFMQARLDLGLTQHELALRLGVSRKAVWRWENGMALPYPRHRRLLCALFQKTAEELGFDCMNTGETALVPPEASLEAHFRSFIEGCQVHPTYQDEYQAFLKRSQIFHHQYHCSVSFVDWFLAAHPEHLSPGETQIEHGFNQPA